MSEQVHNNEELDALPNFTVVVSTPAELDGEPCVIAIQKIGGTWVAIGTPFPLTPEMISPDFYPGDVVYRLKTAADTGGLG